jgi:hypothetical protein
MAEFFPCARDFGQNEFSKKGLKSNKTFPDMENLPRADCPLPQENYTFLVEFAKRGIPNLETVETIMKNEPVPSHEQKQSSLPEKPQKTFAVDTNSEKAEQSFRFLKLGLPGSSFSPLHEW